MASFPHAPLASVLSSCMATIEKALKESKNLSQHSIINTNAEAALKHLGVAVAACMDRKGSVHVPGVGILDADDPRLAKGKTS